ncbi:hypothetical protein HYT33_03285 [Candidatus Roizmanbacteria bacterium]|nr:hypothetical protein [Candidatus Roizmanbacteria bacterium]
MVEIPQSRKELFRNFRQHERFREIYDRAREYLPFYAARGNLEDFKKDFAGAVYEDLIYTALDAATPEGMILLSPQQTFEFFQDLYPDVPDIHNVFQSSLENVSVPDGLLFRLSSGSALIPKAVLEYTLSSKLAKVQRKIEGWQALKDKFPQLFSNTNYVFVATKTSMEKGYSQRHFQEVNFIYAPFTAGQFKDYVNSLIAHYNPNGQGPLASVLVNNNSSY